LSSVPDKLSLTQPLGSCEIDWNHRDGKITLRGDPIGYTRKLHGQYVIEQNQFPTVLATTKSVRQSKSRTQTLWANSNLWHRIHRLGSLFITWEADPVRIRGPSTAKCSDCALAKITQQISRRPDPNKSTRPFHKIHIDWFDLEHGWDGYQPDRRMTSMKPSMTCNDI